MRKTEDYLQVSVEQMINDRGNGAMNQFVIHDGNLLMFQSYSSLIAVVNYDTREIAILMQTRTEIFDDIPEKIKGFEKRIMQQVDNKTWCIKFR